jgi:hypothetical protein
MCTFLGSCMLLDMRMLSSTISGSLFIGHALGHALSGKLSGMGMGMGMGIGTDSLARHGRRKFVSLVSHPFLAPTPSGTLTGVRTLSGTRRIGHALGPTLHGHAHGLGCMGTWAWAWAGSYTDLRASETTQYR